MAYYIPDTYSTVFYNSSLSPMEYAQHFLWIARIVSMKTKSVSGSFLFDWEDMIMQIFR